MFWKQFGYNDRGKGAGCAGRSEEVAQKQIQLCILRFHVFPQTLATKILTSLSIPLSDLPQSVVPHFSLTLTERVVE
jgi:hypothetical protein